jgi:hypothetical protein
MSRRPVWPRVPKREERRREANERAARQRQADAELRDELIAACHGNVIRSPRLDDVSPIRRVLGDGIPLDVVLGAVRSKTDLVLNGIREKSAPEIVARDRGFKSEVRYHQSPQSDRPLFTLHLKAA